MEGYTLEEAPHTKGAKIKIIGCGGGGGNTINYMIREGLSELDLIVANTDGQALNNSLAKTKIQLGEKTTGGLGAGGDPKNRHGSYAHSRQSSQRSRRPSGFCGNNAL